MKLQRLDWSVNGLPLRTAWAQLAARSSLVSTNRVSDWPLFYFVAYFSFFDPFAVNVHTIVIWRQNGSDASHDADSEQRCPEYHPKRNGTTHFP